MDERMNLQSYVDLGWSVFPVKGPAYGKDYTDTKRPLVETWKPYQSRKPTPEEVTDWLKRYPKMSLAAPTGPVNGFFVVDIDSNDWIKAFPNADFGTTWKSHSKRGCHYFYKWEDWMFKIPTTGSEIGKIKGFDIRGQGGYVVVPNTQEPDRGWDFGPKSVAIEPLPDWCRKFLLETFMNGNSKKSSAVVVSEITEGNRHASFLSLTGKLHKIAHMPPEEILQILSPLAEKTGFIGELPALITDVVTRYPVNRREALRPESMEALLSEPEPPLKWMIEGLWTDQSRGFIAGHPGVGKTWIALDMLISLCTGGLCMGKYKPAYRAPCLLIEEEASRHNLQRRIHALARSRGLAPSDLKSLLHITRQFAKIPQDSMKIVEIIKENGIKFVVFDSLRRFHSANENSSNEMQAVLDSFAMIGVMGECSVLLIHHLSKGGKDNADKSIFERMRGSSDFWAWRDCIIGVEGKEDAELAVCSFQFRDAESQGSVQVRRCVGALTGAIGLEAVSMDESEDFISRSSEIIAFVKSQMGGATRNQICKAIEGRKQDNLKMLRRLEKTGKLVKNGSNLEVPN
jgi:hypothetical protein